MAPPVPNPANVLVGPAYMYTAPANTTKPADTLAVGTIWTSPWVYSGATDAGVTFTSALNTQDHPIEEQTNPAIIAMTSADYRIEATLKEDLMENLVLSVGHGGLTTIAAATGVPGTKEWNPNVTLTQYAVGFEGVNTFGFWRRFYFAVAVGAASPTVSYRRAASTRMYQCTFRAICPPAGVSIKSMTAAALP